jgi:hypothetical protein
MTQRSLFRRTLGVIAVYAVAIGLGIYLRVIYPGPASLAYETYKDLIPLIIAIPAAYLAFAFQRRTSYVQALRALWSTMVTAVQGARTYVRTDTPTRELYDQTLAGLSIAIEEARAVFKNLPVSGDDTGWFPFEPIKQIHDLVRDLGYGSHADAPRRTAASADINSMWKAMRDQLLREFDRDVPTHHHTWYVALSSSSSPAPGRLS